MSKAVGCILLVFLVVILVASVPDDVAAVAIAEVERPFYCNASSDLFIDCFMCGRLANDKRIYNGCCAKVNIIQEYCKNMLA